MKHFAFILTACLTTVLACESETISPEILDGIVLERIDHANGNQNWLELFEYNEQGQLKSIEDQSSLGRKKTFIYNGTVALGTETVRLDTEELIFRDSLVYNNYSQLKKVYKFSANAGSGVPLSSIQTLYYDDRGQVIEIASEFVDNTDYRPRKVFTWQNGNIIQEDNYNGDQLLHEFYMTYDSNPALNASSIFSISQLEVSTKNNVTKVDWTDHTGLLDTACKPCTTSYTYNLNGLPASMETNWGHSAIFTYKQLSQPEED